MATRSVFLKPSSDGSNHRSPPQETTLGEYLALFMRGKWTILSTLLVVFTATAIYTFTTKPVYESTALVLVDMKGARGSLPFSANITGEANVNKITNELEILRSRAMAQAVAQKLVDRRFLAPGTHTTIPIIDFLADDDSTKIIGSVPEIMERLDHAIDFNPVRESDIIRINARSTDAREATLLANTYAETYVERNVSTSRSRSHAVREFLQEQREAKKQALDTSETALQSYMRNSGTVSLDEETKKIVEQLSQLEASRDAIEVELSSREKTLNSYKEELARQEPAVARSIGESNDSYVRLLQDQLAKLEVQRDVIIAQNPSLVGEKMYLDKLSEIETQIAALKEKLRNRTTDFLNSLVPSLPGEGSAAFLAQTKQKIIEQQIELEGLGAKERALNGVIGEYEAQFNQIPKKSMDLARLQRARISTEKLYLLIEERFNEAAITEKSEFGYVDIVDPALEPIRPVSPKTSANLILGLLAGLGLGVILVIVKDRLDIIVKGPEDLSGFDLKATITVGRMVGGPSSRHKATNGMVLNRQVDAHVVAFHSPLSSLAESYRQLRTNIQFSEDRKPVRSVLLTSPKAGDGKSTTAANLAISFAQNAKKVLLVDADLRQPILHKLFSIRRSPGLVDFVLDSTAFAEVVQKQSLAGLDIVCSGSPAPNPAEIPGSQGMQSFINAATQIYDIVLFDSAPILVAADATILASELEASILVISSGSTRLPEVDQALAALRGVGATVLGAVLNKFDARKVYGSYKAYNRHGLGYGAYYPKPTER
ncbi:MAG TPA: polysaccharide biosynthesis tyrosine autokinase [Bacteroidota bacterium]|nr:polysaccharide biosynthesis tyrosine autokinase [Bacteroidota bacterium]